MTASHELEPGVLRVRGAVSAEEVAAIVAAVEELARRSQPSSYERWRKARLSALKARPSN